MRTTLRTSLFLTLYFGLTSFLYAQTPTPTKWEIGPRAGTITYQGDLVAKRFTLKSTGPLANLYINRTLTQRLSLEFALGFGAFAGQDQFFPDQRKKRFLESLTYAGTSSISAQYNFLPLIVKEGKNWAWTPFLSVGGGYLYTKFDNSNIPNTLLESKLKNNSTWFAPVGTGIRLMNVDQTVVTFSAAFNPTGSDLIEGVSESANKNKKDTFVSFGFSLGRRF